MCPGVRLRPHCCLGRGTSGPIPPIMATSQAPLKEPLGSWLCYAEGCYELGTGGPPAVNFLTGQWKREVGHN